MKLHLTGLLLLTLCLSGPIITVDAQERATFLKGPKDATDQYSGLEYGPSTPTIPYGALLSAIAKTIT